MKRHRYMIVEHPSEAESAKEFHKFVLPIHCLLGTYHWARLDAQHVFVTGYYEVSNHAAIHSHPKVSALPMIGSSKKIKAHIGVANHWRALFAKLSLPEDATSADVAEAAEREFGVIFGADK